MLDNTIIRDGFLGLGQLIARADGGGYGQAAAEFLATVLDASRVQYWELSAQGDAFVLRGDAKAGDSLNAAPQMRIDICPTSLARCPFNLIALTGKPLHATTATAFDLSRVRQALGTLDMPISFLPLRLKSKGLFGCTVAVGTPHDLIPLSADLRVALKSIVLLGTRNRHITNTEATLKDMAAALKRADTVHLKRKSVEAHALEEMLPGRSPAMRALRLKITHVAKAPRPAIVITPEGESAEPAARALHHQWAGGNTPFIAHHAGTLIGEFLTLELFGHKRGIVPGVAGARRGALREATHGTLLIERVDVLQPTDLEQLIRMVQSGTFRPLGSTRDHTVATNIVLGIPQNSLATAEPSSPLQNLYFQLKSGALVIPNLRQNPEDAQDILAVELRRHGFDASTIKQCLADKSLVSRLTLIARDHGRDTMAALIGAAIQEAAAEGERPNAHHIAAAERLPQASTSTDNDKPLTERVARFEAGLIAEALAASGGNRADAAHKLSIPKRTLADKCKRYGL